MCKASGRTSWKFLRFIHENPIKWKLEKVCKNNNQIFLIDILAHFLNVASPLFQVAVVRRHHRDFCHRVHGPLTTQLSGGCRDGGVVGSSLLMIGVLTCATLPGLGWSMGAALVAGVFTFFVSNAKRPSVRFFENHINFWSSKGAFLSKFEPNSSLA